MKGLGAIVITCMSVGIQHIHQEVLGLHVVRPGVHVIDVTGVKADRNRDLALIRYAFGLSCRLLCPGENREQNSDEYRDDCNHDK